MAKERSDVNRDTASAIGDTIAENIAIADNSDWQKQACYAWEAARLNYWRRGLVQLDAAADLIRRMARDFKLPMPTIKSREMIRGAWARPDAGIIKLNAARISPLTPIHEFAHYCNPSRDRHGPQFIRNYIHLIARYDEQCRHMHNIENRLWDIAIEHRLIVAREPLIAVTEQMQSTVKVDMTDLYNCLD